MSPLATWKEKYRFAGAAEGNLEHAVAGDFESEVEDETRDGKEEPR